MHTREFVTVTYLENLRTGCPMGKPVRSVPRKSLSTILTNQKRLTMELHITDHEIFRPSGEGGNDSPGGKFMKLGGKVNFGVLSSKLNVIRAKKGAISLFLTNKTSFSCLKLCFRLNEYECWYTNEKWLYLLHLKYLAHPKVKDPKSTS